MARATRNPHFLRCKEERNQEGFFKVLQSGDTSSENMRAIPLDFASNFSDKELSRKMKIKTQWGSSWEVGISKNPRFYFMEKSGWEKFVGDNALGDHELLTFTHKGKMHFTVKIFKKDGKEMIQPPQSGASSSRVKTEQDVKMEEEVVVPSELSYLGAEKTAAGSNGRGMETAAGSNGRGMEKSKLNSGKKKADESQNSKRTEKMFSTRRDSAGASSSSVAGFNIFVLKSHLIFLPIPKSVEKKYFPKVKTMFKIHHPDGNKSWDVLYLAKEPQSSFSAGWLRLSREYPLAVGDTCKFSFIKPKELLLIISKP